MWETVTQREELFHLLFTPHMVAGPGRNQELRLGLHVKSKGPNSDTLLVAFPRSLRGNWAVNRTAGTEPATKLLPKVHICRGLDQRHRCTLKLHPPHEMQVDLQA